MFGTKKEVKEEKMVKSIYFIELFLEGSSLTLEYENVGLREDVLNRIRKAIFDGTSLSIGDMNPIDYNIIQARKIIYWKRGMKEVEVNSTHKL